MGEREEELQEVEKLSGDIIAAWSQMSDEQRIVVLIRLLRDLKDNL